MLRLILVALVALLVSENRLAFAGPTEEPEYSLALAGPTEEPENSLALAEPTENPGIDLIPSALPVELEPAQIIPFPIAQTWPCYPPFTNCWTEWFDRDNPSGSGDWETLSRLRKENPGKICSKPAKIQAVTLKGLSAAQTGESIYKMDTNTGFVCRNKDQKDRICQDYKVRFFCHSPVYEDKVCWTKWLDRDNPGGTGDWESLKLLRKQYKICASPLYIQAVTVDTMTDAKLTGNKFKDFSPSRGLVCLNKHQKWRKCRDYKVRFGCQC